MSATLGKSWQKRQFHRDWLAAEAVNLLDFFSLNAIDPAGGFYDLDREGEPMEGPKRCMRRPAWSIATSSATCSAVPAPPK